MGVMCHWIDENYFVQKRLLAYRVFDEEHTANNIAMILKIIFQEYSLETKIFSISFDNAASNTASIPELERCCKPSCGGKFFHIRCAAHVLNLCVQDGLRDLAQHLQPIKNAINLIWTYSSIRKEWKRFCKANGKRPKAFPRDVPTRWNSTYRLLNDCFEYKELLSTFLLNNYRPHYFEPAVWDNLFKILNLLATFNFATERLSGVYYATSHLVLQECVNIAYVLYELHTDPDFSFTSISMKIKLCKYFLDIPMLNLVATVLEPRIKLDGLEEYLTSFYTYLKFDNINLNNDVYSFAIQNILDITTQIQNKSIENILLQTRNIILELLSEMSQPLLASSGSSSQTNVSQSSSGGFLGSLLGRGRSDFIMQERIMKKPKSSYNSMVELELYLSLEFNHSAYADREFDVLSWWREHAVQLPTLSVIARAIFGCPVSTVAVEQAFSTGGNTLSETRSMLQPSSLEAQLCLDDWTKAEQRCQGQAHLEDYDQFDLSSDGTQTGESEAEAQQSVNQE